MNYLSTVVDSDVFFWNLEKLLLSRFYSIWWTISFMWFFWCLIKGIWEIQVQFVFYSINQLEAWWLILMSYWYFRNLRKSVSTLSYLMNSLSMERDSHPCLSGWLVFKLSWFFLKSWSNSKYQKIKLSN